MRHAEHVALLPTLSIAFDGKPLGIGVELQLVMIPAQRAAPLGHGSQDEGDEVLMCVDRRDALPSSYWGAWVFKSPVKESKHPRPIPSGPA